MWKQLKQSGQQMMGSYVLPIAFFVIGAFFMVMARLTEPSDLLTSTFYLSGGFFLVFFGILSVCWIVMTHCLYCYRSAIDMPISVGRVSTSKTIKRRTVKRRA